MKKLLSTLMVIACLALAIPAQAQIKFGVKGGLNVSKPNYIFLKKHSNQTTEPVSLSVRQQNLPCHF